MENGDLISRSALIKTIEEKEGFSWGSLYGFNLVCRKRYIDNAPAIEIKNVKTRTTNHEIYSKLMKAVDSEIESWGKADKLTPIEQAIEYNAVISGIVKSALYLLPTEEYFSFRDEVRQKGVVI